MSESGDRAQASNAPSFLPLLAYCGYAIPVTALPAVVLNLVPPYYAESFGLSLASIGTTFFALRLFDAVTDPAMGWLIDRRPFRLQHKPWIALALPLFLLGGWLLFFPPTDTVGILYLFGAGFVTYSAYTIGLVTHQAWGAALARSPEALTRIFGLREVAVIVGILGAFVAPAVAEGVGYSGIESKIAAASLFIGASMLLFTVGALAFAPDGEGSSAAGEPGEAGSMRAARDFLLGREFLWLSIANLAQNFAMVSLTVVSYFLAVHAFGEGDRYAMGITLYFVSAGLALVFWMRLARRIGDGRALVVAATYAAVMLLPLQWWIELGSYLVFMALLGVAFGAAPYLLRAMIGALAHAHEARTGESVRGLAYAVATFFDKLGSGVAAGVVLPLVGVLGFDPKGATTEEGVSALVTVTVTAPIAGFALVAIAVLLAGRAAHGNAAD